MWLCGLISLDSFWKNHSIYSSWNCKLRKASGRLSIGNCTCHPPQGVHTPLLGQSASDSKGSMKFRSSSWGFKTETKATKAGWVVWMSPDMANVCKCPCRFSSHQVNHWNHETPSCIHALRITEWLDKGRHEQTSKGVTNNWVNEGMIDRLLSSVISW